MCGIAGAIHLDGERIRGLEGRLRLLSEAVRHRGPDGDGMWLNSAASAGFAHRRLAIVDLSDAGAQPMVGQNGAVVIHNGEVYNFVELREALAPTWAFRSGTDTETILAAHARWADDAPTNFRGMFAYAHWDDGRRRLFAARDRFGIKPFYYAVVDRVVYFASEIKALLPFLPEVSTNPNALAEYLTFQFTLGEQTLFNGVYQLPPAHALIVENGSIRVQRYWDVDYKIDWDHTPRYFEGRLQDLLQDSMRLHLRADVPIGAYVSGGFDSSLIAILSSKASKTNTAFFHGRFTDHAGYDESAYAQHAASAAGGSLHVVDITADMFRDSISQVIYHLDHPVAGPGSFPQYIVAGLASRHVKVVLGGQGGDEIFGGYARYLIAYLEQCIRAAIDGTYRSGNFVVTLESIIPRMGVLREYKPLLQQFWKEGMFGPLDERYFRLINRSTDTADEVDWTQLPVNEVFDRFRTEFNRSNVGKDAYFDRMTHFDFKFLLPALLQVEDRMGMAHGLESRVPFLDHPLIEFAASIPADIKFKEGQAKHVLKDTYRDVVPRPILERRDKMGFPVPLAEWLRTDLRDFAHDTLGRAASKTRGYVDNTRVLERLDETGAFSRKIWGLLSLELWHQQFHDRGSEIRKASQLLDGMD